MPSFGAWCAEMRAAERSKLHPNTVVIAPSAQRFPREIRAVVGVHALGYAPDGPLSLDLALEQPGLIGQYRVCHAQGDGNFRWLIDGQLQNAFTLQIELNRTTAPATALVK